MKTNGILKYEVPLLSAKKNGAIIETGELCRAWFTTSFAKLSGSLLWWRFSQAVDFNNVWSCFKKLYFSLSV